MSTDNKTTEAEIIARPLHFKGGKVAPNRLAKVSLIAASAAQKAGD
jgi:hypothetical protein